MEQRFALAIQQWLSLFMLFIMLPCYALAQQQPMPENPKAVVLWNGFNHEWTYNHRLNRLGNYIVNSPFEGQFPYTAQLFHVAATGTGADVGKYNAYYTYLTTTGIGIYTDSVAVVLSGREGELHTQRLVLDIPADSSLINKAHYVALLNGFDIVSEQRADKLQVLQIKLSNPQWIAAQNIVRCYADITLLVRCQSLECNRFNKRFQYTLAFQYAVIGGNQNNFYAAAQTHSLVYNWDKQEAVSPQIQPASLMGLGNGQYKIAALGISGIRIALDRPHWMVGWHMHLDPNSYQPKTGKYDYGVALMYRQWEDDMQHNSAYRRHSRFSVKRKGWAMLDVDVVLLQFSEGMAVPQQSSGVVTWLGKNASSAGNELLKAHELVLPKGSLEEVWQIFQARHQQEKTATYRDYAAQLSWMRKQKIKKNSESWLEYQH